MSQVRRSARLAARRAAAALVDLSDGEGELNSDDLSDGSETVSEVAPDPACGVCGWNLKASGPISRDFLQCCENPAHLQCISDLVHESSPSVICSACNAQSPSSVDFHRFQHLCCVHHVETPAGECMICSAPQSMASSLSVPSCRQRVHHECWTRSVHSCGDRCPFCTGGFP